MPTIEDKEFGKIIIRKYKNARQLKIRRAPNGKLNISAPTYTPLLVIKKFISQSRKEIRSLLQESAPQIVYENGMQIGKSHSLLVAHGSALSVTVKNNIITIKLPDGHSLNDPEVIDKMRPIIIRSLRKEAKGYLPRRLDFLARQHNFEYNQVRFSHASSRWGSCSSNGNITLNIALMKLPFELIDYVILHELAHTKQMNHSSAFWQIVEQVDANYRLHRAELKNESPHI